MKLYIIPFGNLDKNLLHFIKENVNLLEVEIKNQRLLPKQAYNKERKQYNAAILLHLMEDLGKITLGITDRDIYTPGLNFVFGIAEMNGNKALVSTKRLSQEFYGLQPDFELLRLRTLKEVNHEIGHVLGLEHCTNKDCVMYFSNSILDTDRKSHEYCKKCKKKILEKIKSV